LTHGIRALGGRRFVDASQEMLGDGDGGTNEDPLLEIDGDTDELRAAKDQTKLWLGEITIRTQ
jgi:hypothetical protein